MGATGTVLIIDNSNFARQRMRAGLEAGGFKVVGEAENAAQAQERFLKLKPDLVTLDLFLTEEHGFAVLKNLLKLDADARIVVVSAMTDKPIAAEALLLGAKAFVIKTEDSADLNKALSAALKKKS